MSWGEATRHPVCGQAERVSACHDTKNRKLCMALVACRECHHKISNTAITCPRCGFSIPKPKSTPIWPWIIGVPIVLFIAMMIYGSTIPEYQHTAREARNLCEDMAKASLSSSYRCAELYQNIITKGQQAERAKQ